MCLSKWSVSDSPHLVTLWHIVAKHLVPASAWSCLIKNKIEGPTTVVCTSWLCWDWTGANLPKKLYLTFADLGDTFTASVYETQDQSAVVKRHSDNDRWILIHQSRGAFLLCSIYWTLKSYYPFNRKYLMLAFRKTHIKGYIFQIIWFLEEFRTFCGEYTSSVSARIWHVFGVRPKHFCTCYCNNLQDPIVLLCHF